MLCIFPEPIGPRIVVLCRLYRYQSAVFVHATSGLLTNRPECEGQPPDLDPPWL
jgi:hypothetical protein